jgi:hypothetical protein
LYLLFILYFCCVVEGERRSTHSAPAAPPPPLPGMCPFYFPEFMVKFPITSIIVQIKGQ